MVIEGFKGLLGFLTILPVGMKSIETTSKFFFLCPIVGLMIGAIAGAVGWGSSVFLPQIVSGFLALAAMQVLIGFHHFDGLLDFSDAVMVRGNADRKLEVMHDKYTGAAAVGIGFIVLALTGLSLGHFAGIEVLRAAVVSEVIAKESMVLMAYFGKPPLYEGMGKHFVESMKNANRKMLSSLILSAVVIFLLVGEMSLYVLISMAVAVIVLKSYANRVFGCVTGDILGASNEINRAISLLVLLATIV